MSVVSDAEGNFVPLWRSGTRNKLHSVGYNCGLSVESVNLKFADGRDRSVHGTIRINTHRFKACAIYDRSSDKADRISSPLGGDLSICGPRYFVVAEAPTALYVYLYEVGSKDPFFYKRVPLLLSTILPNQTVAVRQSVEMACGGLATLTMTMTSIRPCASTHIVVDLVYPESYNEWLVSGSVTVTQTLSGGRLKRPLRLFGRSEDEPIRAAVRHHSQNLYPGKLRGVLDLDRKMFLSPVWFEKSFIKETNKSLREADAKGPDTGIDPNWFYGNGVGSSMSLEFDLKLVDSVGEGKYCRVGGSFHYQFKGSHQDGSIFKATLKGGVFTDDVLITAEDEIEVFIYVQATTHALYMEKEPYESEIPLFTPPADEIESSEDDESDDELSTTDLMDEGIIKPTVTEPMKEGSIKPVTDPMDEESKTTDLMDEESNKEILKTTDLMDGESNKRRIMPCTSEQVLRTTDLMDGESNKRRIMSCTSKEILGTTDLMDGGSNKQLPISDRMGGEVKPLQTTDVMGGEGDNPVLSPELKDDDLMEGEP